MLHKSNSMSLCSQGQHSKHDTKLLSSLAWSLQNQRNYLPRLSRIWSSCIGLSPHHPFALYLCTGIGTTHSCPCISACGPRVSVQSQKIKLVNHIAQVRWSEWGQHLQLVLHGLGGQQGDLSSPSNITHCQVPSLALFCYRLALSQPV